MFRPRGEGIPAVLKQRFAARYTPFRFNFITVVRSRFLSARNFFSPVFERNPLVKVESNNSRGSSSLISGENWPRNRCESRNFIELRFEQEITFKIGEKGKYLFVTACFIELSIVAGGRSLLNSFGFIRFGGRKRRVRRLFLPPRAKKLISTDSKFIHLPTLLFPINRNVSKADGSRSNGALRNDRIS